MKDQTEILITEQDDEASLQQQVQAAIEAQQPLEITGGGTKAFYGLPVDSEQKLDITGHVGVVNYEPTELAITVRCGTPLKYVESLLRSHGQQLPFEPPHFGENPTIGGMVASGLSGPARAYGGSVRDAILGARIINGRGEILNFGGQVMKNVAGYDTSRLMTGAMGTLGVLLEVSLKVMPRHTETKTLVVDSPLGNTLQQLTEWAYKPATITATCWVDGKLYARLGGTESSLAYSAPLLGGKELEDGDSFWTSIREQQHAFFTGDDEPLWRLSVAPAKPLPEISGEQLIEWNGALRWLKSDADAAEIRNAARQAGGHASLFRYDSEIMETQENVFPQPSRLMERFHRNLKKSFDPQGIFNPGRLYYGL